MSRTQGLSVSHVKPGPEHPSVENVLVIRSAHPNRVLRALEQLRERPTFANPRDTLFCRNRPEILEFFKDYPTFAAIRGHSGVGAAWKNLRSLRRERFVRLLTRKFLPSWQGFLPQRLKVSTTREI
jgi:transposase